MNKTNGFGKQSVGVAILGCGYWGINYVRVLNEIPESRVIAVCDKREERLQEVARRTPGIFLTTDLEKILQRDDIDAVAVCTEATSHFKLASQCLRAGKHVLVEKPITVRVEDAEELDRIAEENRVKLMVGHTFLYNAGIAKVKECLDQRCDRIYYMHASRTNLGPIRRDVNAVWDLATHDIAIFNYLLRGVPNWVNAVGAKVLRNCREDVAFVCLGYDDGVLGHIHVSWADPNKSREIVVVCSERRIVFNDLNAIEPVRIYEKGVMPLGEEPLTFGEYQLKIRDGDIVSPRIEPNEPLKTECRHFLDCVMHNLPPATSARDGINVLRTLEAIDRSIKARGATVEVEKDGYCSDSYATTASYAATASSVA
jgi:predicted dehydrogenase